MDNIRITIDTNAAETAKTFEQLSRSFDDSTKSSEDLRKQIKALKDDLYKLEPGTKEYAKTLEELGGKMDQLSDTQQELRVATGGLDTVFQTTTQATASLAAGFTAAAGTVALFGGDAENLQKTFVKLQAAMAIMNGLKGFAEFPKALKRAVISMKAYITQTAAVTTAVTAEGVALDKETASYSANTAATIANTAASIPDAAANAKVSSAVKENTASMISFTQTIIANNAAMNQHIMNLKATEVGILRNVTAEQALTMTTAEATAAMEAQAAAAGAARAATTGAAGATAAAGTAAAGATTGIGLLIGKIKSLITWIKGISTAATVALAVVTAWVAFMSHLRRESKKVQEQLAETAKVEEDLYNASKKLEEKQNDVNKVFNKSIETYKKLGISEDKANKLTYNHYLTLRNQAKAQYDSEIALAKYLSTSAAANEEWEKHNNLAKEAAELLKKYEEILAELDDIGVPEWMLKLNEEQQKFTRNIERAVNQGVLTEGQGLEKQLNQAKNDLAELNSMLEDYYSGNFELMQKANERAFKFGIPTLNDEQNVEAQIGIYEERIEYYTQKLEDYNDKLHKSMVQSASSTMKTSQEQLRKLNADFSKELDKMRAEYTEKMNAFSSLVNDSDFGNETAQARLYQWQTDFKKRLEDYVNSQKQNAQTLKLTSSDYAAFISGVEAQVNSFEQFMANSEFPFPPEIAENVQRMQQTMLGEAQTFATLVNSMKNLVKEGKITNQEYLVWLTDYIQKYQGLVEKNAQEGQEIIDSVLSGMDVTDEEKERLRTFWSELFNFSDNIIPPETADTITNDIKNMIDNALTAAENELENGRHLFDGFWDSINRSWLEGGKNTSYFGDSASATFKKMMDQADQLYEMLHKSYTDEAAYLTEQMTLLDEGSEAWNTYYMKLNELRQKDAEAQAAHEEASLAASRQYAENVIQTAGKFGDAIGGLAGAMGDYYAEQAEQAKAMYGENSEEYKKYLKKEGSMKIAQVWVDAATGIMSAWATSESLGPIAGPILAAIQTAALLATAVASTQQIKRQTQANASGGASTANVSGITDRVVFGEAQNADQQAQLNAEYNQGATRVFVTEGDINNAQGNTRTAVTNNTF